jgi:hypothetical protein
LVNAYFFVNQTREPDPISKSEELEKLEGENNKIKETT